MLSCYIVVSATVSIPVAKYSLLPALLWFPSTPVCCLVLGRCLRSVYHSLLAENRCWCWKQGWWEQWDGTRTINLWVIKPKRGEQGILLCWNTFFCWCEQNKQDKCYFVFTDLGICHLFILLRTTLFICNASSFHSFYNIFIDESWKIHVTKLCNYYDLE